MRLIRNRYDAASPLRKIDDQTSSERCAEHLDPAFTAPSSQSLSQAARASHTVSQPPSIIILSLIIGDNLRSNVTGPRQAAMKTRMEDDVRQRESASGALPSSDVVVEPKTPAQDGGTMIRQPRPQKFTFVVWNRVRHCNLSLHASNTHRDPG